MLHVVDASHPAWHEQRDVAAEVLQELGVPDERIVMVYNKVDRLPSRGAATPGEQWISATTGEGLAALKDELRRRLGPPRVSSEEARAVAAGGQGESEGEE